MSDNSWQQFMSQARARYAQPVPLECRGRLTKLTGMVLEASGLRVPVGAQCHIHQAGQEPVLAEVVGFAGEVVFDATKPDGTPRKLMDVAQRRFSPSLARSAGEGRGGVLLPLHFA